ncbi:uncharacterized protein LOC126905706 [Daktulosphaira vitifoliae]|uniref:uncharacterized protein LOC126905706 n=1 Tax=Daktulosphaira vitifoliae TaxID=58002 RepID=UPI0021A9E7D1|nr:uncharacterized protein LOC126905706 [Daktulosphaira vitifoliae]
MNLIQLKFAVVQIYVCHSLLRFCGQKKKITNILNNRGWAKLKETLHDTNEKEILLQAFNDLDENDKKCKAANILNNLYGTLQIEIYQFYHCISSECIEEKNYNVEFLLTEFKKLGNIINVFEPLLQCMIKALDYLERYSDVHNVLCKSKYYYKEINTFLLDKNLQKLKNKNSYYVEEVLNKLKEVNQYHYNVVAGSGQIKNNFDYTPFVEKYINQFKNLSNHENQYYPDPNHVGMKKKIEEGVQKFCKDFGFN